MVLTVARPARRGCPSARLLRCGNRVAAARLV